MRIPPSKYNLSKMLDNQIEYSRIIDNSLARMINQIEFIEDSSICWGNFAEAIEYMDTKHKEILAACMEAARVSYTLLMRAVEADFQYDEFRRRESNLQRLRLSEEHFRSSIPQWMDRSWYELEKIKECIKVRNEIYDLLIPEMIDQQ